MYSSIQIANFFIEQSLKEREYLTPMKLQKLVFFAHGWHLAYKDVGLLDEQVEAWKFGPVVSSLYHRVKRYGNTFVKEPISDFDQITFQEVVPCISNEDIETRVFLESIWNVYKKFSGTALSDATHVEGSPWYRVYNDPANQPLKNGTDIPEEYIKEYFKSKMTKATPVAVA